jgi:hypothetical protein
MQLHQHIAATAPFWRSSPADVNETAVIFDTEQRMTKDRGRRRSVAER